MAADKGRLVALRGLAHPIRLQMLGLLWQTPASVSDLSRAIGISHGLASQHLKVLREAELVRKARTEVRRGGRADIYEATGGTPLTDVVSSDADIESLVATMASMMGMRSVQRAPGEQALAVDAEFWVEDAAWSEYCSIVVTATSELHKRALPASQPGSRHVGLTVLGLTLAPDKTTEAGQP